MTLTRNFRVRLSVVGNIFVWALQDYSVFLAKGRPSAFVKCQCQPSVSYLEDPLKRDPSFDIFGFLYQFHFLGIVGMSSQKVYQVSDFLLARQATVEQ